MKYETLKCLSRSYKNEHIGKYGNIFITTAAGETVRGNLDENETINLQDVKSYQTTQ